MSAQTSALPKVLTPLGAALAGAVAMFWSLESRIEKRVERQVTERVTTAVEIEALKKSSEQQHTDLWKLELRIQSLEGKQSSP
jgi:hypothetical protein